jgi:hypothetical protein
MSPTPRWNNRVIGASRRPALSGVADDEKAGQVEILSMAGCIDTMSIGGRSAGFVNHCKGFPKS